MNLQSSSLEQLKSFAYDQIVTIEQAKYNLKVVEDEIAKRSKQLQETAEKLDK